MQVKANTEIVKELFDSYGVKYNISSKTDEKGNVYNHIWFYLNGIAQVIYYRATILNQKTLEKDLNLILSGYKNV